MYTRVPRSEDTGPYAPLLLNESWTSDKTVKCILTLGCWTLFHCLYLQCHKALTLKNDGPVTVVERLYYYNNK